MESSVEQEGEESVEDEARDLRLQFEEFSDGTMSSRALAEKCRDYRDGKQWSDADLGVLKKRKQPPITDNKIQDKCDALLGIERQTRTDPKAFPRKPENAEAADAATDALRYVADTSQFVDTVKEACDNLMVEGLCAAEVIVEKRKGKYAKVCMNHIRWDRLFYDIRSLRNDFQDKRYAGFFTWMDYDAAKEEWPSKTDVLEQCITSTSIEGADQTHDDKPRYVMVARGRKRVQVFTHYYIDGGKWMRAVWVWGGFLEEPKVSNYKNEDGEPDCCIELQALYRDRDGNPYGLVQRYLDLQDEINKRRSKLLHLLNTKQIKAEKGGIDNIAKYREQVHLPDGVMENNPGFAVEVLTNLDLAQGQFQILGETLQAMAQTGPNASIIGNSGKVSGRAKQIDQQAGMLPIGPLFDALRSWKLRMYRHSWNRIKQYWRQEMWIRVSDSQNTPKFVGLNQKSTYGEKAAKQLAAQNLPDEQKQAMVQQLAQDPQSQNPIVENDVSSMEVDIIIDESPDTVTVQQEQYEQLAELAKTRPDIPTTLIIEASSLRNKKQLIEQMTGANDPNKAAISQLQQQMGELEQKLKAAQVAKTVAETEKIQQQTATEHIDASIKVAHATDPVQIKEVVN